MRTLKFVGALDAGADSFLDPIFLRGRYKVGKGQNLQGVREDELCATTASLPLRAGVEGVVQKWFRCQALQHERCFPPSTPNRSGIVALIATVSISDMRVCRRHSHS